MAHRGTQDDPGASRKAIGVPLNRAILRYGAMLAALSFPAWAQAPPGYPYYQPQPSYQGQPSYQQPSYPQQPYYQQQPAYQQQLPPESAHLSQQDLSNLVAPIALYPDLLLSEVLAASTYPLELVQAEQWMQRNPGLRGRDLVEAAKQQNWDPSVQALFAFPDVVNTLTRDIQWTTALGNAFLSQQNDVMDVIQQLRASAYANGRLTSTPQQQVTVEQQNGQNAVVIQPTDPQVVYPPIYNPQYVWGPPAYGTYPPLWYPPLSYGIFYAAGTFLSALFTGLLSFGGWGWGLSWLTHGLFLNSLFFSHFGFHGFGGGGFGYSAGPGYAARVAWTHNPVHRLGVPYGNRSVAARYGGSYGGRAGVGAFSSQNYGGSSYGRSFESGRSGYSGSNYQGSSRQAEAYRGLSARNYANVGSYGGYRGGYSSAVSPLYGGSATSFRSPESRSSRGSFSSPHYSAPKSSGHFGGGGHSGGHSHSAGGHSHGGSHRK